MGKRQKPRMGRPPRGEYPEKSEVANFRIRPDTKRLLMEAAAKSGRSLSQETEHQLRRALADMGAGPTFAIMRTIGKAIDSLVNLKKPRARWTDDPYLFSEAAKAMNAMLDMLRPPGQPPPQKTTGIGPPHQGDLEAEEVLHAIQTVNTTKPFRQQSPRERELTMLRADLGELADRPRVRGLTAEQQRRKRELLRHFVPLRRKAEEALSEQERQQMIALWQEIEAIKPGVEK